MPTYEYLCKCGNEFEEFQSIKAPPGAKCPVCGKKAKRLISAGAGLIFKGTGFYITDYKNQNASYSEGKASEKSAATEKSNEPPVAKSPEPTTKSNDPKTKSASTSAPSAE